MKFHETFSQILPINYNEAGDNSDGYFGYDDGHFTYNSTYFDDVMLNENGDRLIGENRRKDGSAETPSWAVTCENCYMYYLPEVLL